MRGRHIDFGNTVMRFICITVSTFTTTGLPTISQMYIFYSESCLQEEYFNNGCFFLRVDFGLLEWKKWTHKNLTISISIRSSFWAAMNASCIVIVCSGKGSEHIVALEGDFGSQIEKKFI